MNATELQEQVKEVYARIARAPADSPPLPAGRALAENVGYPASVLDTLPEVCVEAFCGVSNVSMLADYPASATVLDLGCGAGLDTLLAARRATRVIGVDFCPSMLDRARRAVDEAAASNVELRLGTAQAIPVDTASVDLALVNGIFNLNPYREEIFRELARVVRPGGAVFAAELVLAEPLSEEERLNIGNWFS